MAEHIVNMQDAKTRLSELVALAEAGETVILARHNKPVVKLLVVGPGYPADWATGFPDPKLNPNNRHFTIEQIKEATEAAWANEN